MGLLIGLSVVFVAQNGFNRSWSESTSSSNSSSSNQPVNSRNNLQSNQFTNEPLNPSKNLPNEVQPNQPNAPINPMPNGIEMKIAINGPAKTVDHSAGSNSEEDTIDDEAESIDDESGENSDGNSMEHEHKEHHHEEHHEEHYEDTQTPIDANDQNINYIFLVSYFRSGSSFVGDLLQQTDSTFYTYEPLKFFDFNHKVDAEDEEEALRILQNILHCLLNHEEEYSDWVCFRGKTHGGWNFARNQHLWKSCESDPSDCCDTNYVDGVCSRTKTRIIKETRISLASIEKLLQRLPPTTNIKIVFLVRDPRAIYQSRKHFRWCKTSSCIDYEKLCEDLTSDLEVYPRLVENYGDKITMVRFEDIALEPFEKGEALYNRVNLPYTSETIDYIYNHTNENNVDNNSPYSTLRNSKQIITKWIDNLNETIVDAIQDSCGFVFQQLGYKSVVLSEINQSSDIDLNEIFEMSYPQPNHL